MNEPALFDNLLPVIPEEDFIQNTSFTGADFSGKKVTEKEFYKCTFVNCNLTNMQFTDCRFENCVFDKCDLSLSKFINSEFIGVTLIESKLLGIDWTTFKSLLQIKFNDCSLNHSVFYGLNLKNLELKDCTCHEMNFEKTNLTRAICTGTDFLGTRFNSTDISFADFSNAVNYSIDPNYNTIRKAKFSLPEVLTLLQCFDITIT